MAALGDSITAALGTKARTVLGLLVENRGRSWSMGGDQQLESLVTLPNILKKFNAQVYGFNTGAKLYPFALEGDGLNVAVSGGQSSDMVEQARRLVRRLRKDKSVDFENDWKVVTLFVGGNDLCDYCEDKEAKSPQRFITMITEALDFLYAELPRTFVNMVTVLNIDQVGSSL